MIPEDNRTAFEKLMRVRFLQQTDVPLCHRCEEIISEGDYCVECSLWLEKEISTPPKEIKVKTLFGFPVVVEENVFDE